MIRILFKTLSVGALLPALAAILVLSAPSPHANAQTLFVGNGSSDQTTSFTSGTTTYTAAFIGNTSTDSNNTLNVLNPGTRLTINGGNVQVGFAGSGNSMVISNGGFVSDVNGVVSFGTTGSNNSALVTGAGSTWSNSNQVRLGVSGSGTLTVANGGSVIASGVNGIQVAVNAGSMGVLNIGSYGGNDSAGSIVAPKIGFNSGTGYLNFNQTDTFTLTNAITGVNTILFQQLGSGTTILTGANSSANSTLISNGTLQIGDGGANGSIGNGAITNNSVLAINSSTDISFANNQAITGTGVLVQMGTGTTTLVANNTTYSGGTLISNGTLRVGAGPTGPQFDTNGSLGTGNVTNNATLLFSRRAASDTVFNNISGTGALTMFGSGALTLAGSNSYSGLTTIGSSYTLQIGTGSTNGTLGTGSVSNAGILSFNRSDLYTASNAISGTGAIRQIGTGTTILLGSNSYSGATTVTNGVLQIGNGGTTGSIAGDVVNNATLIFNRSDASTYSGIINGTGAVTKQGGGTLTLAGANSYSGGTTISDGVLALGSANAVGASGTIRFGGGTLQYSASNTTDYSSRFSTAASQAYSIDTNGQNVTWASPLASSGGTLTKSGTGALTLAGANSYSGVTTISGGTLALSGAGSIGTGGLNLGSGGVFALTARTSGTYSLPSTGDLIGSGTLTGNGHTLAVLGAFQPGNSPGTVTVDTGFTLDLSGATSTTFDITDPLFTAGTYDLVNGNGSMIFGGILNLAFSGGSYADGADMLQLFSNTGGFSGDFTSVVSTGLAAGQAATFNAATGFISITSVPEPSTYAMALAGLACGGWQMMRRRRLR